MPAFPASNNRSAINHGLLPGLVVEPIILVWYVGLLSFEWFLARQLLRVAALPAFGVIALDLALSLTIDAAMQSLLGGPPASL